MFSDGIPKMIAQSGRLLSTLLPLYTQSRDCGIEIKSLRERQHGAEKVPFFSSNFPPYEVNFLKLALKKGALLQRSQKKGHKTKNDAFNAHFR